MSGTLVSLLAAGMIIWMILQKRKAAAISFSRGLPESSLRYRLAQKWHHFAIFAVIAACWLCNHQLDSGHRFGPGDPDPFDGAALFSAGLDPALDLEAAFGIVTQRRRHQAVPC